MHVRAHAAGDSQQTIYPQRCSSATARLQRASYDHLLAKSIALRELWLPLQAKSGQRRPHAAGPMRHGRDWAAAGTGVWCKSAGQIRWHYLSNATCLIYGRVSLTGRGAVLILVLLADAIQVRVGRRHCPTTVLPHALGLRGEDRQSNTPTHSSTRDLSKASSTSHWNAAVDS